MAQKTGIRIRKAVCFVLWRKRSMPARKPKAPPIADRKNNVFSGVRRLCLIAARLS
ncbi:hypothetical protein EV208_102102 [Christensenella hongkongensis]|nr:hypothetical protein EV208_102102 [Christensenella hongkongensis]